MCESLDRWRASALLAQIDSAQLRDFATVDHNVHPLRQAVCTGRDELWQFDHCNLVYGTTGVGYVEDYEPGFRIR